MHWRGLRPQRGAALKAREHRHAQQHAREAEQAAAHDDGQHDPEGRQAHVVAQDQRADHVAVQLLQYDDEHQEHQAVHRVFQQQQQRAGNRTDIGAEDGDDIGHADDK